MKKNCRVRKLSVGISFCLLLFVSACSKRSVEMTPSSSPSQQTRSVSLPDPDHPSPTVEITASPSTINIGSQATLRWKSTDSSSLMIDSGVGNVSEVGSLVISPRESTTYTVTAKGPGGEAVSSTRVTVIVNPKPIMVQTDIDNLQQAIDSGKVQPVFFDYDKATLTHEAKGILQENARIFLQFSNVEIVIEGHCDERGTEEYNLALGDRRAEIARNYLIEIGGDVNQLESLSFGEERPFSSGHDERSWRLNRRVHFTIQR